jgi:hypothetical protein
VKLDIHKPSVSQVEGEGTADHITHPINPHTSLPNHIIGVQAFKAHKFINLQNQSQNLIQ